VSLAWYIVLQQEIPGFDATVSGKGLAHASEVLDSIAKETGVLCLMDFFSVSPDELAGFAQGHDIAVLEGADELPGEKWFSAAEGLKTVRALVRAVEETNIENAVRIVADLKEFERVLQIAEDKGVSWHLAVDF
jgi:hypothetical protein